MVYSGRGRPPKGMSSGLGDGGRESSDEEEDAGQGAVVPVVESEVVEKEYSEEETDEEVRILCYVRSGGSLDP